MKLHLTYLNFINIIYLSYTSNIYPVRTLFKKKFKLTNRILIFFILYFWFFIDQRRGIEGIRAMYRSPNSPEAEKSHLVGISVGDIPVVSPAKRELEFEIRGGEREGVGEGDGGKAERNFERRGYAGSVGEWPPAGGGVGGGKGPARVGCSDRVWCFNNVCLTSTWR